MATSYCKHVFHGNNRHKLRTDHEYVSQFFHAGPHECALSNFARSETCDLPFGEFFYKFKIQFVRGYIYLIIYNNSVLEQEMPKTCSALNCWSR